MDQRPVAGGYVLALLALMLATLVRWLLEPYLHDNSPFPTYFAAVALVALYGGIGPALLTVIAGSVLTSILFVEPQSMLALPDLQQLVSQGLFVATSALIVALAHWLRSSTESLAAIVSTAHEGIVTRDLDGRVTGWNAGAERIYGYRRDEMIGVSLGALLPPGRSDEAGWLRREILAGRPVEALETERIRKDGHRIDVLLSAAPIRNGRGRIVGIATMERDVSERNRAERARRAIEARLRAIIDNSPVVLYIKDLQGRYFLVNQSYADLFGTTVEKVLGVTDFERFPAAEAEAYRKNDQAVLSGGVPRTFEESSIIGGEMRTFLSTKFPLRDDNGEVYAVCGISTDITEETRRHQQLLDLDQRKDQFLSMLAHELRNPLAPILNAVQLIRLREGLDDRTRWAGEVIERQARHLTRMVDDLLDIARFNTGRVQLRREIVNVVELARQSVEDLRSRFHAAEVNLSVSLPDFPVHVDADSARLVQVLDNLLDNAAKYTDAGGNALLEVTTAGGDCVVCVRDTGIGIAPEHLGHVFDLFEQVDASLDRASGGLGLGLNLVKRMVEAHGGTVEALSAGRGAGSEFVIRLPLAGGPAAVLTDGMAVSTAGSAGRRILVIEDNPDTARSMEMLLDALGHEVQVARTGGGGIELAARQTPDLVLVDLGLPDIDGYQVARQLRQRHGSNLRLVALTGYGQPEHRQRTREAGFDEHLLKPLTLDALHRLLEPHAA